MEPNKEKELRKHLKTLDKDQLIELLIQFKCDAELLQGVANDTLDAMNEKLVLEKALELACEDVKYYEQMRDKECGFFDYDIDYDIRAMVEDYIQQAKESLKNDN